MEGWSINQAEMTPTPTQPTPEELYYLHHHTTFPSIFYYIHILL